MADVFISYKREDREQARLIADALKALKYEVWWDIELLPGQKFSQEIKEIITGARAAIVLWSKAAVNSPYVLDEAALARSCGILVPAKLDDCEMPLGFGGYHTLDLSNWHKTLDSNELQPLIKAVEYKIGVKKSSKKPQAKKNAHDPEVEALFWRQISERENQSFKEYQLYLEKYGENAMFSDLAKLRINALLDAKDSSSKLSVKQLFAIVTTVIGILTAVVTLVIKSGEVVKLFTKKEADVQLVTSPKNTPDIKSAFQTETSSKSLNKINPKTDMNTKLKTLTGPSTKSQPITYKIPTSKKSSVNISLTPKVPEGTTTKHQSITDNKLTSEDKSKNNSKVTVERNSKPEFLLRSIKYEIRYSIDNKLKANVIEKIFKDKGLNVDAIPLNNIPKNLSNKIYYPKGAIDIVILLQNTIKEISYFDLIEYKSTDNDKIESVRINVGN